MADGERAQDQFAKGLSCASPTSFGPSPAGSGVILEVLEQGEMKSKFNLAKSRDKIGRSGQEKQKELLLWGSCCNRRGEDGLEEGSGENEETDGWLALAAQGEGWAKGGLAGRWRGCDGRESPGEAQKS